MSDPPRDYTDLVNARRGGFTGLVGLEFTRVTADEVVAHIAIGPQHRQAYGLVHGGVYCAMIETLCSVGAAINALPRGQTTVGLEQSTAFLRAVRDGIIRGTARPLTRGRRSQAWRVEIRDDRDRLVASGRVRMLCLEPGAAAGGAPVVFEEPIAEDADTLIGLDPVPDGDVGDDASLDSSDGD